MFAGGQANRGVMNVIFPYDLMSVLASF